MGQNFWTTLFQLYNQNETDTEYRKFTLEKHTVSVKHSLYQYLYCKPNPKMQLMDSRILNPMANQPKSKASAIVFATFPIIR